MRKISPELKQEILVQYHLLHDYKAVGKKLGVDWRTVRRVVEEDRRKKAEYAASALAKSSSTENPLDLRVMPGWGITQGDLKLIFKAFREGKRPNDIVEEKGVDPYVAEKLYERFKMDPRSDYHRFRDILLATFGDMNDAELRGYYHTLFAKVDFKPEELHKYVLKLVQLRESAAVNNVFTDHKVTVPQGWTQAVCPQCHQLRAIVNLSDPVGKRMFIASLQTPCIPCQSLMPA